MLHFASSIPLLLLRRRETMVSTTLLPYLQRVSIRWFHSFTLFHQYSTSAQQPQPQPLSVLQNYLINPIGFTPEAASTATKKLRHYESFRNDPDLVLDYLKSLGLNKDQIRSMISANPKVLTYSVNKTLEPKIRVLQDIGLTGSDIVKILCAYNSLLVRGVESLVKRIQFLKDLLGSYENVAKAVRNCATLLHIEAQKKIEYGVSILRETGLSDQHIAHFLMHCPYRIIRSEMQWFQDVLHRVEHDLGIPRNSRMFFYGFKYVSSLSKSTMDEKLGVLRSFGWSDATIQQMVRSFPTVLGTSIYKLKKCLSFLMGELGCSPELLASNPVVFCLSLEKIKLRSNVLKVLNEKKLNQRKKTPFAVLLLTDQNFLKNYLLPHQNEIPILYESYIEKFGPPILKGT